MEEPDFMRLLVAVTDWKRHYFVRKAKNSHIEYWWGDESYRLKNHKEKGFFCNIFQGSLDEIIKIVSLTF